ncbi:MAG: hypothetical protein U5R46_12915 [Gammaproteobacteria bacterium]|nr:hypothetical protein [Gammaproteobacteria bacterium]
MQDCVNFLETIAKFTHNRRSVIVRQRLPLTDEQREQIKHHFPKETLPAGRSGRKPTLSREVPDTVLSILLPHCNPNHKNGLWSAYCWTWPMSFEFSKHWTNPKALEF